MCRTVPQVHQTLPKDKKIGVDTWYYAKRCMLALAETLAKNMVVLNDEVRCPKLT